MDLIDEVAIALLQTFVAHELRVRPDKPRLREAVAKARDLAHTYLLARAAEVEHAVEFGVEVTKQLPPCLLGYPHHWWRPNALGCRRCHCPDRRAEVRREQQRALMAKRRRLRAV